jgi:hypothetical protein
LRREQYLLLAGKEALLVGEKAGGVGEKGILCSAQDSTSNQQGRESVWEQWYT